jgi:hypothetical protein
MQRVQKPASKALSKQQQYNKPTKKKANVRNIPNRGKKRKVIVKPINEKLLLGNSFKPEVIKYTHNPLLETKKAKATASHMPAEYPGYTYRHRLNEFTVDSLSPIHTKFCELPDGSGSRYSMISYQRTKPFTVKGYLRRRGASASRKLRDKGLIPCSLTHILHGKNQQVLFAVDPILLEKLKLMKASWGREWHIDVEGFQENIRGFLRDWQIDPVTRKTGSLRFVGTSAYHPTHVHIPLEFEGHEDGNASKKGAMMLTPHTNIQGIWDPSASRRLGTGAPPMEIIQITHDREPHHTVRAGDIAIPNWVQIPAHTTWSKHVLMTFTKNGM